MGEDVGRKSAVGGHAWATRPNDANGPTHEDGRVRHWNERRRSDPHPAGPPPLRLPIPYWRHRRQQCRTAAHCVVAFSDLAVFHAVILGRSSSFVISFLRGCKYVVNETCH